MTSSQKRKGDVFELALRAHLADRGFAVSKTRAGYERDHGDLHILGDGHGPTVIIQAKNRVDMSKLGAWLRAAVEQRTAAQARHGIVVAKRVGIGAAGRQYAVMELDDLLALLREAGYATGDKP